MALADATAPRLGATLGACRTAVESVAFWGAVALPAVYLPALFAGASEVGLALVAVHAVAVVAGHRHARPSERP